MLMHIRFSHDETSWKFDTKTSFLYVLGVLKNSLNQQFEQLIQQIELASEHEKIVWGQHYEHKQFPHRNGYRRHLVVNLLAAEDGRRKFTKLLQEQLVTVKSDDITCNLIDEKMSAMYGAMPDPDCAVYFGSFQCTQGLLPWQIRLTEFYQLSYELSTISPQKYLNVIYKYGKCEQRFGKWRNHITINWTETVVLRVAGVNGREIACVWMENLTYDNIAWTSEKDCSKWKMDW